jgi:hypothetical protein
MVANICRFQGEEGGESSMRTGLFQFASIGNQL